MVSGCFWQIVPENTIPLAESMAPTEDLPFWVATNLELQLRSTLR
jgi:hypothetical protein